jgi:hypothetical protein
MSFRAVYKVADKHMYMACRICLEEGNTKSLCGCRGTQGFAHVECVQRWVRESGRKECELCSQAWTKEIHIPIFREKYAPFALVMGCILQLMFAYLLWFETCIWPNELSIYIIVCATVVVNGIVAYMWQCYFAPYRLRYTYLMAWCTVFFGVSALLVGFSRQLDFTQLYFPWVFSFVVHASLLTHSCYSRHISERQSNAETSTATL